jgi:hypothetical protein
MKRDPRFTKSIEEQTERFGKEVDDIVESNTFIAGFKNVQNKVAKNPNDLTMYQHDFKMKMAKIESQLSWHVTSIGD